MCLWLDEEEALRQGAMCTWISSQLPLHISIPDHKFNEMEEDVDAHYLTPKDTYHFFHHQNSRWKSKLHMDSNNSQKNDGKIQWLERILLQD